MSRAEPSLAKPSPEPPLAGRTCHVSLSLPKEWEFSGLSWLGSSFLLPSFSCSFPFIRSQDRNGGTGDG